MSGSFNRDPIVAGYTPVHKYGHHRPAAAATAAGAAAGGATASAAAAAAAAAAAPASPAAPGWKAGRGTPGLPPVDSKGLEAVLAKLVGMGPNMVPVLWSAIEEVSTEVALLLKLQ